MVIRGAASDVLPREVALRMEATGAEAFEVPDTGHAPALVDPAQILAIRSFLTG
jgi:pimeloyl-ACP methyl ester carboxylesterase